MWSSHIHLASSRQKGEKCTEKQKGLNTTEKGLNVGIYNRHWRMVDQI